MQRLTRAQSGFTAEEYKTLARLSTPIKIQDFLDTFAFNWEKEKDTLMSPRRALEQKKANCLEGTMLAAAALWINGEPPLIMNVSPQLGKGDDDHVIALYKRGGRYGAISKTNHAVLRFRDPIYRTPREVVLSYFHEWFLNATGEKLLECYSKPLNLTRFGTDWLTAERDLWEVAETLSNLPHYYFVPKGNWRYVRNADPMELKAGRFVEWPKSDPRT